ncbi:MAG: glycosyltransferase family 2 protein [Beijerinckiaceae bacterium]
MKSTASPQKFGVEAAISLVAIIFTLAISIFVAQDTYRTFVHFRQTGEIGYTIEFAIFSGILLILLYGSIVYLLARMFYYVRLKEEEERVDSGLPMDPDASLTVLIPSYREEKTVIWRTLVSAAMVEHPNRRCVLLVDDPPNPRRKDDMDTLAASRAVAGEVNELFASIAAELSAGVARARLSDERAFEAAELYDRAAAFVSDLADKVEKGMYAGAADHTRSWFVLKILREPAIEYFARAQSLRAGEFDDEQVAADLDRLDYLFKTKLEFFERKLYVNTPKGADKATNLNAYLSMMGRRCALRETADGIFLDDVPAHVPASERIVDFADSTYVLVLDADSIVLPNYARTLLGIMETPEGERIGVAQTPYLTFPNATSMLERVAGATTDIQFIIHQGMGALGAGFWVGANALVRMTAFREIAERAEENGFVFYKFVQDRTVIEDTGSTIDLRARGWSVHNHVVPLAWSATPPDFGTLTIQRRRWANGGLILLPDFFGYMRSAKFTRRFFAEAFLRFHYLGSQAFASFGVLALLLYPFDDRFASNLLPLTAIPYFFLYGRDLRRLGYSWADLPRVYALNLLLLPVIIAGVARSIHQMVFAVKTPFARTPKIEGRTAAPATYLAIEIGLFVWMLIMFQHDVLRNDREHAFFALTSALAFAYGFIEMIGVEAMAEDIVAGAMESIRGTFGLTKLRAGDFKLVHQVGHYAYGVAGVTVGGAALLLSMVR